MIFIVLKRWDSANAYYADAPTLTRSMQVAFEILNLDELNVICPGDGEYKLAKKIRVVGIDKYCR